MFPAVRDRVRRIALTAVFIAAVFLTAIVPDSSDASTVSDEYWCCGDHIAMSFGSDSANVSWTITDDRGNVIRQESGESLELIASDYDTLIITQTVETGQGKSVKTVKLHLLHLNDRRISAVFYDSEGGNAIATKCLDGSTVCKNGIFFETPEVPEAPEGMVFGGWYERHGEDVTEFDPTVLPEGDTEVFATWLQTYRVMFVSDGNFLSTQTVVEGQNVVMPEVDSVPGKEFGGWFTDPKCKNVYVPGEYLDSNTVLYAKWDTPQEEQGSVTYILLAVLLTVVLLTLAVRGYRNKGPRTAGGKRYR